MALEPWNLCPKGVISWPNNVLISDWKAPSSDLEVISLKNASQNRHAREHASEWRTVLCHSLNLPSFRHTNGQMYKQTNNQFSSVQFLFPPYLLPYPAKLILGFLSGIFVALPSYNSRSTLMTIYSSMLYSSIWCSAFEYASRGYFHTNDWLTTTRPGLFPAILSYLN